jgi:hypothetical protein
MLAALVITKRIFFWLWFRDDIHVSLLDAG